MPIHMKMFDGLLKSKFYSKCKSDLKQTRTRIDLIKKKRNVIQKYLRNDIVDLLKNELDIDAYGRAEGFIAEMNRSDCYEFIDQCCEHISNHLGTIEKQRECPEDCREAASSLMFAAARFADLPELRQLRTLFSERYGNSLDCYVERKFAEKAKAPIPSKDTKIQLLQDIAAESGLEWSPKVLENELFNRPANPKNNMKGSVQRQDSTDTEPESQCERESHRDRKTHPVKDDPVDFIRRNGMHHEPVSGRNVAKEEEREDKPPKYNSIPPLYSKSEVNKPISSKETLDPLEWNHGQDDSVGKAKQIAKSVRRRIHRPPPGQETAGGSKADEKEKLQKINKDKAAEGQRVLKFFDRDVHDQRDEKEKMMDKLLQYYSRKGSNRQSKSEPVINLTPKESPSDSSTDINEGNRSGPNRVFSLPDDSTSPTENPRRHTRASSLQPNLEENARANVHPKLPDYDEFVARLAALRRNGMR